MELSKKREKTLDRNLASETKELAGVKVENGSRQRPRGIVDGTIVALEKDAGSALKEVPKTAQHNVTPVAGVVGSALSEH